MEKPNISGLIDRVKSENKETPIQKVIPVKITSKIEIQFSFYIEKELLRKVKFNALENDVSIKSVINNALKHHLGKGK